MSLQPWLASYGAIPAHIDPDSHPSIVHLLCAAMQRYAHRPAFTCLGQTLTYAHVDQQSRAFAAYLQNVLRVRKGDRIAVMCPNLMAFPIAMLGIARAGCVQVNVNPLYTPRELEHQLRDAGARVMVIYAGSTATLAAIQDRVELHSIITVAPGDGTAADLPGPPVDAHLHTTTSFARALAEGATLPFAPPVLEGATCCSCSTPGAPRACPRAPCSRTATWWPMWSSSRPSYPMPCALRRRSSLPPFRCITSSP